ncbi:MAG: hypothetical protein JXA68_07035 [Ignavibacteriales bacterium]|nr:hypothetical protein [Ignavibacteriales bacterium]
MKLKTRKLRHPSGVVINTPILIPSYSSKGFVLRRTNDGIKSEICDAIDIAKEILEETVLISAFDLHHDYLLNPNDFISTQLTFLDSGGYETSSYFDFSETKRDNTNQTNNWDINLLETEINKWNHERFPAVIVSFDDEKVRKPLEQQISEAASFFLGYKSFLHDFLIKPETKDSSYINIDSICENVDELKSFHIIGITEKELGNSVLQRMQRINRLRNALDVGGIEIPIHIFGSLDPITSILYFLSGAEIFDGLTWLKYSYFDGLAIYSNNLPVLDGEIQITTTDKNVKARSIHKNIYFLSKLKNVLINFVNSNEDYNVFNELGYSNIGCVIEKSMTIFKNQQRK